MSDKARLLGEAGEEFISLRQVIDGLTDEAMLRVWLGSWSGREILIHISGWHQAMNPALERIARGEEPYPPRTYDDVDGWNARFVERKSGMKIADVLAELVASHRESVSAAALVPDSAFAPGGTARALFEGAGPGHYREYIQQLQEGRRTARR
jgi:hypothetical protein